MKTFGIGKTSMMVKRVKHSGLVSSDPKKNVFIKVGKTPPVAIEALHKVFGRGLCPAALCSNKSGTWRMQCCDKADHHDHMLLDKKAHDLPQESGPNCRKWQSVVDQSDALRKKHSAQKRQKKKK